MSTLEWERTTVSQWIDWLRVLLLQGKGSPFDDLVLRDESPHHGVVRFASKLSLRASHNLTEAAFLYLDSIRRPDGRELEIYNLLQILSNDTPPAALQVLRSLFVSRAYAGRQFEGRDLHVLTFAVLGNYSLTREIETELLHSVEYDPTPAAIIGATRIFHSLNKPAIQLRVVSPLAYSDDWRKEGPALIRSMQSRDRDR